MNDMEGILKFNLPEEESEFRMAVNAGNYYSSLWEMDQWLRSQIKHNDNLSEDEYRAYETARTKLRECMLENDVNF